MGSPARNTSFLLSVGNACRGFREAFVSERNMKIHTVAATLGVLLGMWTSLDRMGWLFLSSAIVLMFLCELFNTAIETTVNYISTDRHPLAKRAKDVSAAACLVSAMYAVIVGIVLFAPPIWEQIKH